MFQIPLLQHIIFIFPVKTETKAVLKQFLL